MNFVWTGNDLTVSIYFDDGNGNRINSSGNPFNDSVDLPVLTYCLFQTARVSGRLNTERRPETGRAAQRIVPLDYQYDMDVSHFYLNKSTELSLTDIFNRERALQLVMLFAMPGSGKTSDPHTLKIAYATDFDIDADDNRIATGAAKFTAELFE